MKKSAILLALVLGLSTAAGAKEVFNWKSSRGVNTYADVPKDLKPSQSNLLNVRAHTVTQTTAAAVAPEAQMASGSISDQQMKLSEQVAAQNKAIEEKNRQIEAQNRKQQEDNCKAARLNRSIAESARSNNRDALLARYDADIQKFCP